MENLTPQELFKIMELIKEAILVWDREEIYTALWNEDISIDEFRHMVTISAKE